MTLAKSYDGQTLRREFWNAVDPACDEVFLPIVSQKPMREFVPSVKPDPINLGVFRRPPK